MDPRIAARAIDAAWFEDDAALDKILAGLSSSELISLSSAAGHLKMKAGRLAPRRAAEESRNFDSNREDGR